jgi:hypothetical protein
MTYESSTASTRPRDGETFEVGMGAKDIERSAFATGRQPAAAARRRRCLKARHAAVARAGPAWRSLGSRLCTGLFTRVVEKYFLQQRRDRAE